MKRLLALTLTLVAGASFAQGLQTEITQEEFQAITSRKGLNRKCLHLTDTGRAFMHAMTMTQGGYSTAGTGFAVEVCTPANWK